jgi:hypothetical protein
MTIRADLLLSCLLIGLGIGPDRARAIPFHGDPSRSESGTGASFTGNLMYMPDLLGRSGLLRIDLENTSPSGSSASVGGFLSAFALNLPDARISGVAHLTPLPSFDLFFLEPDSIDASPIAEDFDIGVGVDGDLDSFFTASDDPGEGIRPGERRLFVFRLTGVGLNELTSHDFLAATGDRGHFFAARFRGLRSPAGGSDSMTGIPGSAPPPATIPEPGTLWTLGLGLIGLICGERWRRG